MKSYFGSYTSSLNMAPADATVLVFDKNISIGYRNISGNNETTSWPIKDINSSFDFSLQQTKLCNARFAGAELLINGNEVAVVIKDIQEESQKPWHKKAIGREWIRNGLLLSGILGLLFLLYLLIVPWLSEKLATKVSVKTEQQLGDAVYGAMDLDVKEDTVASRVLNTFFKAMDVPTAYDIRITVVRDNVVNAFALPGGRIVVYSALLKQINSYPELAALLSHEFTHVNNKHSTKSIFRKLGSKIFIGLLFGKFGNVASVLVNHADDLKSLKYSRRLEKEADMEGLQLLLERKIDPAGFTALFTHLKEASPGSMLPEFLGSHPDIDKRIAYIQENAKKSAIAEDSKLKAIFDQLK
jgi:beta-barrel assembly-enhancing protease